MDPRLREGDEFFTYTNFEIGSNEIVWKVLFNTRQLREWVEAAKTIRVRFGIEKTLGYLMGEKFYRVMATLPYHKQLIGMIAEQRKKPGYCKASFY